MVIGASGAWYVPKNAIKTISKLLRNLFISPTSFLQKFYHVKRKGEFGEIPDIIRIKGCFLKISDVFGLHNKYSYIRSDLYGKIFRSTN